MKCRPVLLAGAVLACLVARTLAEDHALHYLQANSIRVEYLLPAPPTVGSEEQKTEIDALLAIQARRNDDQIKRFQAELKLDMTAFDGVLGPGFTPENLPKLGKLLKAAADESKVISVMAKALFQRKRPYWEDDRLKPLGEREEDCTYPSGHATRSMLFARILAKIEPQKNDRLLERARQIGWDRVIGGVHYPSDVAAGRELGLVIAHALLVNPEFQAELSEAKADYEKFKRDHARRPPAAK